MRPVQGHLLSLGLCPQRSYQWRDSSNLEQGQTCHQLVFRDASPVDWGAIYGSTANWPASPLRLLCFLPPPVDHLPGPDWDAEADPGGPSLAPKRFKNPCLSMLVINPAFNPMHVIMPAINAICIGRSIHRLAPWFPHGSWTWSLAPFSILFLNRWRTQWTPCSVNPHGLLQVVARQERSGTPAQPRVPAVRPVRIPTVPVDWATNSFHWGLGIGGGLAPGCPMAYPTEQTSCWWASTLGSWAEPCLSTGCPTGLCRSFRKCMSLWGFPSHLKCGPTQPGGGHLMGLKKGASLWDICVAATWSFGLIFTRFCCLNVAANPSFGERVLVLSSSFYLQGRPSVLQFDHSSLLCCDRALTRPACMYVYF